MPVATHPVEAGCPEPAAGTGIPDASPSAIPPRALTAWDASIHASTAATPPSNETEAEVEGVLRLALHDLRNALAAIQLGVELLGRREGSAQQPASAVLAHMDHAAQRAQALTLELDDLTRLAAGRGLRILPAHFSLHAVVRDTLDASRLFVPGVVVEHDRLGDGDCVGDAARVAQFLNLALEALCALAAPTRVIVVTEVAGDRFCMAVHAEGADGAQPPQDAQVAQPAMARRCMLLRAIARAHGGEFDFERGRAAGNPSINGHFSCVDDPQKSARPPVPAQD